VPGNRWFFKLSQGTSFPAGKDRRSIEAIFGAWSSSFHCSSKGDRHGGTENPTGALGSLRSGPKEARFEPSTQE
jgi:hypothetical protein